MKKIILIIMTVILMMSCGGKKGLSEESKKRIQEEISKINDNMSDMELENMMTTAKINYDLNPEVGIMYFEKLVKYKPEAAQYMAEYYLEEKKDETNYEKWTKYGAEKGVWELMFNLGVFYEQKNRLKEAEEWYLKSLEINPNNKGALQNLGITYGKQENYEEAEKYFKKIGREESGIECMTIYYETAKQYEKAEKLYKKMIESGDVNGYYGLGNLYRKTNRIKEAKEILKIGAEKGDLKAMYALGIVYYDESNHSEARKYFLMGAEKNHINSIYMVGATYEFQKNYTEARKWYEKAYNMGDEEAGKILKELKGKKDGV